MAGKWAVGSLYMALIVDNLGGFMVLPSLPFVVIDAMHGTPAQYGLMQSAFAGMQVLGTLICGKVSDAVGRRAVMLVCLCTTSFALAAFGQVHTISALFFFRTLDGFFSGTIGVAQAFLADLVEPAERAAAMARAGACIGLGLVLGPAVGGACADFGDFTFVCNVAAGITLFNFAIALMSLPGMPPPASDAPEVAPESLWSLVSKDAMLPSLYVTQFLQMLTMSLYTGMIAISLKDIYGITPSTMGKILFVAGVTMVLAQTLLAKTFSAFFGQRNCIFLGNALRAVDFALMASVRSAVMPYAVPMAFTFCSALLLPNIAALTASRAPETQRGVVMGGLQSLGGIASAIGPFIGGQIYSQHPPLVWWTAAAISIAAALASIMIQVEEQAREEKAPSLLNTEKSPVPLRIRRNSQLTISECASPESSGLSLPLSLMSPDSGGAWGVHGNLLEALTEDVVRRGKTCNEATLSKFEISISARATSTSF